MIDKKGSGQNFDRQTNYEVLRILAMLMIVLSHYCFHGESFEPQVMTLASVFWRVFTLGGIGVICFVLISAYFWVDSSGVRPKKIFLLWATCFVFSVGIGAAFYFLIPGTSWKVLVKSLFPVTFNQWWFASCYLVICLFVPYINRFIRAIERATYEKLLFLMFVLWILGPTLTSMTYGGSDLTQFLYLYLLIAYIKIYPPKQERRMGWFLLLVGGIWIVTSVVVFQYLGQSIMWFWGNAVWFNVWTKMPQTMVALGLFLIIKTVKMKPSRWITKISSATFCVYLLHDHELTRRWLWLDVFNSSGVQESWQYFVHCAASVAIVFVGCTLIGLLYKATLERAISRMYDFCAPGISLIFNAILKKTTKLMRNYYSS